MLIFGWIGHKIPFFSPPYGRRCVREPPADYPQLGVILLHREIAHLASSNKWEKTKKMPNKQPPSRRKRKSKNPPSSQKSPAQIKKQKTKGINGRSGLLLQAFVESAYRNNGNASAMGRELGVDRTTVMKRRKRHEALDVAMTEAKSAIVDIAEEKMVDHLNDGNIPMIKFYLSTAGGYSETRKNEITGRGGAPLAVHVIGFDEALEKVYGNNSD